MRPLTVFPITGAMPAGENYHTFIIRWWREESKFGDVEYGGSLYVHRDLGQKHPDEAELKLALRNPYRHGITYGAVYGGEAIFISFHSSHEPVHYQEGKMASTWVDQVLAVCRDDLQSRDMAEIEASSNQKG